MTDALRFAFGTLTVVPVRVTRWDRAAARGGMALAPLVGAVVGVLAGGAGALLVALGASALSAAVAAVAVPAALTRGLHLDGLADTADALGSGQPPQRALEIMKQSDIGPFGVITLVLVLLAQVAALAACYGHGWVYGGAAAVVAAVLGRSAMTLACRRGVRAARPGRAGGGGVRGASRRRRLGGGGRLRGGRPRGRGALPRVDGRALPGRRGRRAAVRRAAAAAVPSPGCPV